MPGFALGAVGRFARRAIGAALEARIAQSAATTFSHFLPLVWLGQIANRFASVDVVNDCATRHLDFEVITGLASFVAPRAAFAVLSLDGNRGGPANRAFDRGGGHVGIAGARSDPVVLTLAATALP